MRKERSDKGGKHNYPKRNKNVAADIKISNKQQLLNLVNKNIQARESAHNAEIAANKQILEKMKQEHPKGYFKKWEERIQGLEMDKEYHKEMQQMYNFKEQLEKKRIIKADVLKLYSNFFFEKGEYNEEEQVNKMLFNRLINAHIDISDTIAVRNMLGGYSPQQLYEAFIALGYRGDEWYAALSPEHIHDILPDLVNYLNNGTELDNYTREILDKYEKV